MVSTPTAGNKYETFGITVKNLGSPNLSLGNPYFFKLKTADGTIYQIDAATFFGGNNPLSVVTNSQPGEKVTGNIVFQIPQQAKATTLTYDDYSNKVTMNL